MMTAALGAAAPWREATKGYSFAFPRDHASHPDYKIEWWYYTGNVAAVDGRRFGFQVTFFRVGIDNAPTNPSRWAVRDLFMTHLAVSDLKGQRYRYVERLNRGGPGLAGAAADRYHVWNEDWTASLDANGHHVLRASSEKAGIDLVLDEGKAPVAAWPRRNQPKRGEGRQCLSLLLAHANADQGQPHDRRRAH